jgi:hypothetical protein
MPQTLLVHHHWAIRRQKVMTQKSAALIYFAAEALKSGVNFYQFYCLLHVSAFGKAIHQAIKKTT